jgi:hypothetical protein
VEGRYASALRRAGYGVDRIYEGGEAQHIHD